MTVFGDKAIELGWGHSGWPCCSLIDRIGRGGHIPAQQEDQVKTVGEDGHLPAKERGRRMKPELPILCSQTSSL